MMTRPDEMQDVMEKLNVLAPSQAEAPRPAGVVLAQIKHKLDVPPASPARWQSPFLRRFSAMLRRKYTLAAVISVFLFAFAFSFPTVRAAASDFLGLFRVQKFAAISVSPRQLALLEQIAEQGLYPGEIELITDPGAPQTVASLGQAEAATGLNVRTAAELGKPEAIHITQSGRGRLTVNLGSARAILEAAAVDPLLLPDTLDGAVVDVTIFPTVEQMWADGTLLVQSESPVVDYPDDVNPAVLGEALLQVLGMTEGEARRLSRSIDWTSTLLLPVPTEFATFSEVQVDGVSALGLSAISDQGSALLWQKNGRVYLLSGEMALEELRQVADSLQ